MRLVQEVVQKFPLKATAGEVALDARFEPGLPLASGDIRLVERLLDNLLENATFSFTLPADR